MRYAQRQEHIQIRVTKKMKQIIVKRLAKYGYNPSSAYRYLAEFGGLVSPEDKAKIDELQRIANIFVGPYSSLVRRHDLSPRQGRCLRAARSSIEMLRDMQDFLMKGQRPKIVCEAFDVFPSLNHFEYFVESYYNSALQLAETDDPLPVAHLIRKAILEYDDLMMNHDQEMDFWFSVERAKLTVPVTGSMRNKLGLGPKYGIETFWSVSSSDVEIPTEISAKTEEYYRIQSERKETERAKAGIKDIIISDELERQLKTLRDASKTLFYEIASLVEGYYDSYPPFSEDRRMAAAMRNLESAASKKGMTAIEAI